MAYFAESPNFLHFGAMKFTEKLKRLTKDENKTKVGRAAGLQASAISNYISKAQMPRGDKALSLARALKVPLEWLVDDAADWPPPEGIKLDVTELSHWDLMREICKRFRLEAMRLGDELSRLEGVDWAAVAKMLACVPPDAPIPQELLPTVWLLQAMQSTESRLKGFDPSFVADLYPRALPGDDIPPPEPELRVEALRSRIRKLWDIPGYKVVDDALTVRFSKRAGFETAAEVEQDRLAVLHAAASLVSRNKPTAKPLTPKRRPRYTSPIA